VLELFANQAATTVSSGGTTAPAAGTVQTWTVSSSAGFPAAATGVSFFRITDPSLPAEKMLVTNTAGNTWTVTRGAEGTTPVAHTAGFTVEQVITAGFLSSIASSLATTGLGTPLAGPSASQQTVFGAPDGAIIVLPLSTYGLTGDDAVWINSAFSFCPSIAGGSAQYGGTFNGPWTVGTVRLLPADYILQTGIVVPGGGSARLHGHGPGTRLLAQSGVTAVTVRGYGGGWTPSQPAQQIHAEIAGLRIDGTSAGVSGVGINMGGGWGHKIRDVAIVNFTGASAIGLLLSNAAAGGQSAAWTEKARLDVDLLNNTTCVRLDQSGANGSFEYNAWNFYMQCGSGQQGMVVANGSFLYRSDIRIQGNFADNSGPVLTITGNDGAGTNSSVNVCRWFIGAEHNSNINQPQTILFGATSGGGINTMNNCTGLLSFGFASTAWAQSNALAACFSFGGIINGDANLITLATATPPSGWA
jgi:hypothetical protein